MKKSRIAGPRGATKLKCGLMLMKGILLHHYPLLQQVKRFHAPQSMVVTVSLVLAYVVTASSNWEFPDFNSWAEVSTCDEGFAIELQKNAAYERQLIRYDNQFHELWGVTFYFGDWPYPYEREYLVPISSDTNRFWAEYYSEDESRYYVGVFSGVPLAPEFSYSLDLSSIVDWERFYLSDGAIGIIVRETLAKVRVYLLEPSGAIRMNRRYQWEEPDPVGGAEPGGLSMALWDSNLVFVSDTNLPGTSLSQSVVIFLDSDGTVIRAIKASFQTTTNFSLECYPLDNGSLVLQRNDRSNENPYAIIQRALVFDSNKLFARAWEFEDFHASMWNFLPDSTDLSAIGVGDTDWDPNSNGNVQMVVLNSYTGEVLSSVEHHLWGDSTGIGKISVTESDDIFLATFSGQIFTPGGAFGDNERNHFVRISKDGTWHILPLDAAFSVSASFSDQLDRLVSGREGWNWPLQVEVLSKAEFENSAQSITPTSFDPRIQNMEVIWEDISIAFERPNEELVPDEMLMESVRYLRSTAKIVESPDGVSAEISINEGEILLQLTATSAGTYYVESGNNGEHFTQAYTWIVESPNATRAFPFSDQLPLFLRIRPETGNQ